MRVAFPALLVVLLAASANAQDADCDGLGTLRGVVTDAETGLPVVGAGVVIPALRIGAVSQRDGSFSITCVPAGRHAIRAGAYLYHLVTVEAEADAAGGTLDVALRPGAGPGCAAVHEHGPDGSHMERPARRDGEDG